MKTLSHKDGNPVTPVTRFPVFRGLLPGLRRGRSGLWGLSGLVLILGANLPHGLLPHALGHLLHTWHRPANLLGCAIDIKESVVAITIVALGTSLPDTFASKKATMDEKTADSSIGQHHAGAAAASTGRCACARCTRGCLRSRRRWAPARSRARPR